jgi:hypothetical protein
MNRTVPDFWNQQGGARVAGYEETWGAFRDLIADAGQSGESLESLVARYDALAERVDGVVSSHAIHAVAGVDLSALPESAPPQRLIVTNGSYKLAPRNLDTQTLTDWVAGLVDDGTDCIVEFGAGLGFNLARLRLRLGERPITYMAFEPTQAGQDAARRIFALAPGTAQESHPFDYLAPDLAPLARFKRIVAFSRHSIEQVPVLGDAFHRALLSTNLAACLHAEPVGWQRFSNLRETVKAIMADPGAWNRAREHYVFRVTDSHLSENAAMWAALRGYNTDFLQVIAALSDEGALTIKALAYDAVSDNPFNPSTLTLLTP